MSPQLSIHNNSEHIFEKLNISTSEDTVMKNNEGSLFELTQIL